MAKTIFTAATPASMEQDEFTAVFGSVFEHAPWVAEQVWQQGIDQAHNEIAHMHNAMVSVIEKADRARQDELLANHPELATPKPLAELTESSRSEQTSAGLASLDDKQRARFAELNSAYRAKFGFPFILAVSNMQPDAILAAFESRLQSSDAEAERQEALRQVMRIGRLRLDKL